MDDPYTGPASYYESANLSEDIEDHSLLAWVKLKNLTQR